MALMGPILPPHLLRCDGRVHGLFAGGAHDDAACFPAMVLAAPRCCCIPSELPSPRVHSTCGALERLHVAGGRDVQRAVVDWVVCQKVLATLRPA